MATPTTAELEADDTLAFDSPRRYGTLKQFGLTILCAVWVVLGVVGHDPWKSQDAVAFGVALDIIERGDILSPRLVGELYVDSPPLVHLIAAGTGISLSRWMPVHDAARVAAALFLALTLLLLAATATELNGAKYRWVTVLLFVGSVGLWERAHQLSPELGLMLGVAAAQYGLVLAARRAVAGGALLGLGAGIGFLSTGLMGPVWLAVVALVLPVAFRAWRTRSYATTAATGLGIALVLCLAWPLALYLRAPAYLVAWWSQQSVGDFVAATDPTSIGDPTFLAKNITWFAWPALPLVLWTLYTRARGFNGGLATPGVQIPVTFALVIVFAVTVMADPRLLTLMPLLLPLCLLAVLEIDTLPRGFSGALDWFGILTFGLLTVLLWWLWFDAYAHGLPLAIARVFRDSEAGYRPPLHWVAIGLSLFLTLLWVVLVRPARRSNRRTLLNWTAGMTLLWALYSTIWLPYLDSRRSYRVVAESLRTALPGKSCVGSRGLGDAQRVLFKYFANLVTVRAENASIERCGALLVQSSRNDGEPVAPDGWQRVWSGQRHGDETERYVLYVRKAP